MKNNVPYGIGPNGRPLPLLIDEQGRLKVSSLANSGPLNLLELEIDRDTHNLDLTSYDGVIITVNVIAPDWQAGQSYSEGDLVKYQGVEYIADDDGTSSIKAPADLGDPDVMFVVDNDLTWTRIARNTTVLRLTGIVAQEVGTPKVVVPVGCYLEFSDVDTESDAANRFVLNGAVLSTSVEFIYVAGKWQVVSGYASAPFFYNLPTSDPHIVGLSYLLNGVMMVSNG